MSDAQRYPLSWPAGWKRTPAGSRTYAAFGKRSAPVDGTGWRRFQRLEVGDGLTRLEGELKRLGATRVVISSNLRLRTDGRPYADAPKTLADPGVAVYFRLDDKPLVLACDRWNSAADNLAAIAGHIEAMRMQQRYGVGSMAQAFAGYTALPAKGETQGGDWRAELGFHPAYPVTLDMVEAVYKSLLQQRHPDRGGSHEAIVRLNAARDQARKHFQAEG